MPILGDCHIVVICQYLRNPTIKGIRNMSSNTLRIGTPSYVKFSSPKKRKTPSQDERDAATSEALSHVTPATEWGKTSKKRELEGIDLRKKRKVKAILASMKTKGSNKKAARSANPKKR